MTLSSSLLIYAQSFNLIYKCIGDDAVEDSELKNRLILHCEVWKHAGQSNIRRRCGTQIHWQIQLFFIPQKVERCSSSCFPFESPDQSGHSSLPLSLSQSRLSHSLDMLVFSSFLVNLIWLCGKIPVDLSLQPPEQLHLPQQTLFEAPFLFWCSGLEGFLVPLPEINRNYRYTKECFWKTWHLNIGKLLPSGNVSHSECVRDLCDRPMAGGLAPNRGVNPTVISLINTAAPERWGGLLHGLVQTSKASLCSWKATIGKLTQKEFWILYRGIISMIWFSQLVRPSQREEMEHRRKKTLFLGKRWSYSYTCWLHC